MQLIIVCLLCVAVTLMNSLISSKYFLKFFWIIYINNHAFCIQTTFYFLNFHIPLFRFPKNQNSESLGLCHHYFLHRVELSFSECNFFYFKPLLFSHHFHAFSIWFLSCTGIQRWLWSFWNIYFLFTQTSIN